MGEIAEMMLDGTLCCVCGVYIGKDTGVPEHCRSCGGERQQRKIAAKQCAPNPQAGKEMCRLCGKKVKKGQGVKDHLRVVHGQK